MKKFSSIIALVLLLALILPSCSSGLTAPESPEPEKKETVEKKPAEKKTEEKKTEPEPIMQEYDPAEDDEFNVLMIGSSSCYY